MPDSPTTYDVSGKADDNFCCRLWHDVPSVHVFCPFSPAARRYVFRLLDVLYLDLRL